MESMAVYSSGASKPEVLACYKMMFHNYAKGIAAKTSDEANGSEYQAVPRSWMELETRFAFKVVE
jgi:hypothetical protein